MSLALMIYLVLFGNSLEPKQETKLLSGTEQLKDLDLKELRSKLSKLTPIQDTEDED